MDKVWKRLYRTSRFAKNDFAAHHCARSDQPLLWSQLYDNEAGKNYTPDQSFVSGQAFEAGYRVGVTIPLKISWSMHTYGMSFCKRWNLDFSGHD